MATQAQQHQYDKAGTYRNQQYANLWTCDPSCTKNCYGDQGNYQYPDQQSVFEGNYPQTCQMNDDDITDSSCRYKHCMDELFDSLPWLVDSVDRELSIQAANKCKRMKSESDCQDIFQHQTDDSTLHDAFVVGVPLSEIDTGLENISDDSTLFPVTSDGWKIETIGNVQDLYTTATYNSLPHPLDSIKKEEVALQATNKRKGIESDSKFQDFFHQKPDNTLNDASEVDVEPNHCKPTSEIGTVLENRIYDDSTLFPVTSYGWQEETVSNANDLHTTAACISLPWLLHSIEMEEQAMQAANKCKRIESDSNSYETFQQIHDDSTLHDDSEVGIAPNYYKPFSEINSLLENRISDDSTLFPATSYGWQEETHSNVKDIHTTAACISLPSLLHSIEMEEQAMHAANKCKMIESDTDSHENFQQTPNDSRLHDASEVGMAPNYCKTMSEIDTELENQISDDSMLFLDTSYEWQDETISNEQYLHNTAACNMESPVAIKEYTPEQACSDTTGKGKGRPKYKCSLCDKTCMGHTDFQNHMNRHSGIRAYVCDICNKSFFTLSNLTMHKKIHTKNPSDTTRKGKRKPNYKCSLCDKIFIVHTVFQDHMNKHNGIRAHVCDICNKSFFTLSNLTWHKKIHTRVEPYICYNCGSDFKNKNSLFAHLVAMVCTRAKKYISETSNGCWSCSTCNLNFQTKEKGYSHARVHQKGLSLLCPVCPENFSGQKSFFLVKHCKTEHPDYFQKLVADY